MRRFAPLLVLVAAGFVLACSPADHAADADADHADAATVAEGEDAQHSHGDEADERDVWSKPDEVYDFLGIGSGDRVVDLMAGGGYNTLRLAARVGSDGAAIAEGGSDALRTQVIEGDATEIGNIEFVDAVAGIADSSVDSVIAVRAYHLFPDVPAVLSELHRALVPGGTVGIVEVRLNEETGHNMDSHRMGEQTVIADMEAAGFEFVASSDLLRRDDDDYTVYVMEGKTRFMTDRMLLTFRKPQ